MSDSFQQRLSRQRRQHLNQPVTAEAQEDLAQKIRKKMRPLYRLVDKLHESRVRFPGCGLVPSSAGWHAQAAQVVVLSLTPSKILSLRISGHGAGGPIYVGAVSEGASVQVERCATADMRELENWLLAIVVRYESGESGVRQGVAQPGWVPYLHPAPLPEPAPKEEVAAEPLPPEECRPLLFRTPSSLGGEQDVGPDSQRRRTDPD